jgi:hypothetical protein
MMRLEASVLLGSEAVLAPFAIGFAILLPAVPARESAHGGRSVAPPMGLSASNALELTIQP